MSESPAPSSSPDDEPDPTERRKPHDETFDGSSRFRIERAGTGDDPSVWDYLTDRYQRRLHVFADLQLGPALRERYSADDLVQEAWLRVIRSFDRFEYRDAGSLFRWLCQQVRRTAVDWGRRREPPPGYGQMSDGSGPSPDDVRDEGAGPKTQVQSRDEMSRVRATLEELPRLYREVLTDLIIEGRDPTEVAAERSVSPDTLRRQKNRGRDLWAEALSRSGISLDGLF